MAKRSKPKAADTGFNNLLKEDQIERFLAAATSRGWTTARCDRDGFDDFVAKLQARVGYADVRAALGQSGVLLCELCEREGRASAADEYVELDTGMRSVGDFVRACRACVPRARGLPPA